MTEPKRRGRPPRNTEPKPDTEIKRGPYRAELRNGKWIVFHGANVRVAFGTRAQAVEYLDWVSG